MQTSSLNCNTKRISSITATNQHGSLRHVAGREVRIQLDRSLVPHTVPDRYLLLSAARGACQLTSAVILLHGKQQTACGGWRAGVEKQWK